MHEIILTKWNNETRLDSRLIADGLGIKHQNFLETLRTYQKQMEELGVFTFETWKPSTGSLGGRPETYAMLNEDQVIFAVTLSRNSEKVVDFKLAVTKAFRDARQRLITPVQTFDKLPEPVFKDMEYLGDVFLSPSLCEVPSREFFEKQVLVTVQRLQPFFFPGVTFVYIAMYNKYVQAYWKHWGSMRTMPVVESLVEQGLLKRPEITDNDWKYYYTLFDYVHPKLLKG